jgi:hypothetical protein
MQGWLETYSIGSMVFSQIPILILAYDSLLGELLQVDIPKTSYGF